MAKIELRAVTKTWEKFDAVRKTNLTIADKEFLVLLGPSGCGKTTTMRMIAGLESPSSGEILIDGKVVNQLEPKDRKVAMVFQSYALYAHLTVYQNICFPLRVRGVPKKEWKRLALRAAELVELGDLLSRYPRELSGGQRQRVALARAIVRQNPNCFLMDEPLSNLDAKLRVSMRTEIKRLQEKLQITTIYVTHDQIEAMTLAHRIALIRNGAIEQLGTPEEIYHNPKKRFVASFIGNPAMNLIRGECRKGVFLSENIKVKIAKKDKNFSHPKVTLGVRAEDLTLAKAKEKEIQGEVYVFEQLGESNLVTLRFGEERLSAKLDKNVFFKAGDKINLKAASGHYYLFDNETEERIYLS